MSRSITIYFFIALLCTLAAVGGYIFCFLAFASERAAAQAAHAEVLKMETEDAALSDAEEVIAALAADEALLASHVVTSDGLVGFLEALERSGEALQSNVEVVSVTEPKQEGGKLLLALRIEGSFEAVMRTLGSLEYGAVDMQSENVTLDTLSEEEGARWVAAGTFTVAMKTSAP